MAPVILQGARAQGLQQRRARREKWVVRLDLLRQHEYIDIVECKERRVNLKKDNMLSNILFIYESVNTNTTRSRYASAT